MSECAIRKVAKSDWMFKQLGRVNDGICGASGSKAAWTAIKTLKRGLGPSKRPPPARMKLPDGTFASSAEENAEVFVQRFDKLYNSVESIYDETILSNLPLRTMAQGLDHTPTKLEMLEAIGNTGRNPNTGGKNVYRKQYTEFSVSDSEYAR